MSPAPPKYPQTPSDAYTIIWLQRQPYVCTIIYLSYYLTLLLRHFSEIYKYNPYSTR